VTGPRARGRWGRGLGAAVRQSRVYRSVVRTPGYDSPAGRALQAFGNVFLHVYPVRVPRALLGLRATWRLGFVSAVLYGVLLATGVALMFVYTPATSLAYGDMVRLRTSVGFGQLIRNAHRWSAHLMVLAVTLHLIRVFVHGAYKAPREWNWVIGVALLVVTLLYSFTGYLLPWDQLSYWAVTVGADLLRYVPLVGTAMREYVLGGPRIVQATLLRFYVLHVMVLTAAFFCSWPCTSGECARTASRSATPIRRRGAAAGGAAQGERACGVAGTERGEHGPRERAARAHPRHRPPPARRDGRPPPRRPGLHLAAPARAAPGGGAGHVRRRRGARRRVRRAAARPGKSQPHATGGQGPVVLRGAAGAAGALRPGDRRRARAGRDRRRPVALPYVDRNAARRPAARRFAMTAFVVLLAAALALTVIGALFRGPGWAFVLPWRELYFEP
jgi:hypothetical protein